MPNELIMPDVKRRSVAMFRTLFGVNMSIFMGAIAPGSEVTFFLVGTSVSTLSITIQSKKISISVIALFDKGMGTNPNKYSTNLYKKLTHFKFLIVHF